MELLGSSSFTNARIVHACLDRKSADTTSQYCNGNLCSEICIQKTNEHQLARFIAFNLQSKDLTCVMAFETVRSVPQREQDAQSSSWVLYLKTGNIYNSRQKTKTHHGDRLQGVGSIGEKQLWIADCFQCSASSHANAAIPDCAAPSSGSSCIDRQLQFHRLWSSIVGCLNAGRSEKRFKWCSKV